MPYSLEPLVPERYGIAVEAPPPLHALPLLLSAGMLPIADASIGWLPEVATTSDCPSGAAAASFLPCFCLGCGCGAKTMSHSPGSPAA